MKIVNLGKKQKNERKKRKRQKDFQKFCFISHRI